MDSNDFELGAGVVLYLIGVAVLGWSLVAASPIPVVAFVGVGLSLFVGTILIGAARDEPAV